MLNEKKRRNMREENKEKMNEKVFKIEDEVERDEKKERKNDKIEKKKRVIFIYLFWHFNWKKPLERNRMKIVHLFN